MKRKIVFTQMTLYQKNVWPVKTCVPLMKYNYIVMIIQDNTLQSDDSNSYVEKEPKANFKSRKVGKKTLV